MFACPGCRANVLTAHRVTQDEIAVGDLLARQPNLEAALIQAGRLNRMGRAGRVACLHARVYAQANFHRANLLSRLRHRKAHLLPFLRLAWLGVTRGDPHRVNKFVAVGVELDPLLVAHGCQHGFTWLHVGQAYPKQIGAALFQQPGAFAFFSGFVKLLPRRFNLVQISPDHALAQAQFKSSDRAFVGQRK